ncbi:MAG: hypothetical protein US86_C0001G0189 [Candidatus Daviesbacteria bacterium GW2011_GWA2_38_24]|uniref:Glycosyltransferase RgtA/B/C/D-like domain-containing protein n=1 Tax=Candidatus Daviesbacteria bacterium GW2011_GWA2_38_24 TaxID=1618422 RepID=A0A0G0JK92_9BACT|nr:MAG: hypothetical protein US86_C0001G0189 [Candidatus Daviesbacteria bacterium GW2011_GWA2_38_24]KKQ80918.1 MAG: hypothetical protein UT01_C0004G0007 [Candidatus Daviesbacteria bacterium GW2011_GWA1_38_7]
MLFINLNLFLILALLILYPIGYLFLASKKNELHPTEIVALSFCIGVIIFVLQAFLFSFLDLRFLAVFFVLLLSGISIYQNKKFLVIPWIKLLKDKLLVLSITLATLVQGFINFPSGYKYKDGLLFWSSQGHDGLWHVSLIEEIKRTLPPINPGISGVELFNYHYLVDVLMGEFARIFPFFDSLDLYFRFFPILFSFMISITIFALMYRWKGSKAIAHLGLLFSVFVGSFGFIISFKDSGNIFGGETAFWASQQNTILGNPPHAISHAILPAFFLAFCLFLKNRSKHWFIISLLLGGVLAGFKVSGGFIMLSGVGVAAFFDFLLNKKKSTLLLAAFLAILNFLAFKSMTSKDAASFLMFLPWWFIRTMVVVKLGWIDMELRRQHYLSKGTWNANLRILQLELTALLIFIVGNLGMRILGIIEIIRLVIKEKLNIFKNTFEIALITSMFAGLVVVLLFVQKGLIYNNIQFMQYFMLIFGWFAAISTYHSFKLMKNNILRAVFIAIVTVLSIPTVIGNLIEFYGPNTKPLAVVNNHQIEALKFLKTATPEDSVILNVPFDPYLKDKFKEQPKPIYAWYDTPYIAALSARKSYLASEHVTLLGFPTKEREEKMKKFFEQQDLNWNKQFLKDENINYIYISKDELDRPLQMDKSINLVFENKEVLIYRVE